MRQIAPDTHILEDIVSRLKYRPGWTFALEDIDRGQGSEGLTFIATTAGINAYHHEITNYRVHHYFPVIPAAFNYQSWRRWVLDRILEVEIHEACEFFDLDGVHPYGPCHGEGEDPYIVREYSSDEARRTSFRNVVKNESL